MTNTNDFRKYSYPSETAALISAFTYTRGSAAPSVKPERRERENELRVHENVGIKSKTQLRTEEKSATREMLLIAVIAIVSFAMICLVLNSFAVKNQLTREIAAKEVAVANAESEYISLQAELNSLVSISTIDKYAVEKLGMTKVKSNQIQYIDVDAFKAKRQKALSQQKDVDRGVKNIKSIINGKK